MLGIPFISDYIHKVVRPQDISDGVDYLNYYCTSLMLAIAALAISAKQYFGSPIQCWVPMEFRGGWEKYTEDYCFIQNSYYVPFEEQIPEELHERKDQISYYRWVPIMLALQALMFFAPNFFWNILYRETAIQPHGIVKEAKKCSALYGKNRDNEVRNLAQYIAETVSVFMSREEMSLRLTRSGRSMTLLYLLTKLTYVINIVLQIIILNHFLDCNYLKWGFEVMQNLLSGREWVESRVFPRVIMCDFEVRRLGNIQRHTVQCVIMMNMINEKLYLILWFWFIAVGICTVVNFCYYFIILCIAKTRFRLILWNVNKREWKMNGVDSIHMKYFIEDFLRPDGVLLLKFINEHVGARISRDLVHELILIFAKQANLTINDRDMKQRPSEALGEKSPLTNGKTDEQYHGNYGKNIKFPHLTSGKMPLPSQMRSSLAGYETAPALEDFIDGASTLPVRSAAHQQVTQPSNASGYGSPRPQQQQSTPTDV